MTLSLRFRRAMISAAALAAWPGMWLAPGQGMASEQIAAETSACERLEIAACRIAFSGSEGANIYRCFDAWGHERARSPVSAYREVIPCSPARMQAYVAAFENPCYHREAFAPGANPLPLLLDRRRIPASVCYNIDRSRASFRVGGSDYVFETIPGVGGGNFHGTTWTLGISPPQPDLLLTRAFPFLACPKFYAAAYCQWHLMIQNNGKSMQISANDLAPPCQQAFAWRDVFAGLSQRFRSCQADDFR